MKPTISEHDHQVTVIEWCELMAQKKYPMLRWLYACPNGARVSWKTAKKLKAEGMKAGVPDLCLPYPAYNGIEYSPPDVKYHGLYIEMKTKGGRVSPEQKEYIKFLLSVGYQVNVCWTADEAIKAIEEYLNG